MAVLLKTPSVRVSFIQIMQVRVQYKGKSVCKSRYIGDVVRTPILRHIDLACNTPYHFAASRTVFPRVSPYHARDHLRLLAHVMIVSLASI